MFTTQHRASSAGLARRLGGTAVAMALMGLAFLASAGTASARPAPDPIDEAPSCATFAPVHTASAAGTPLWLLLLIAAALVATTALPRPSWLVMADTPAPSRLLEANAASTGSTARAVPPPTCRAVLNTSGRRHDGTISPATALQLPHRSTSGGAAACAAAQGVPALWRRW